MEKNIYLFNVTLATFYRHDWSYLRKFFGVYCLLGRFRAVITTCIWYRPAVYTTQTLLATGQPAKRDFDLALFVIPENGLS